MTTDYLHRMFLKNSSKNSTQVALQYYDESQSQWAQMDWKTYQERVLSLGCWMLDQGIKKGDRVAILSANRPEWIIADLAILTIGAVSVPIYATSTLKDIEYVTTHSETKMLLCDSIERAKGLQTSSMKVVTFAREELGAYSLSEIFKSVPASNRCVEPNIEDSDIATIIYTSGTTGFPKGVIHTHGNLKYSTVSVNKILHNPTPGAKDRYFSFLPLSHVAERMLVEIGSIVTSSEICFARSVAHLSEDLVRFRPTVLLCVPRLWEKIFEKIQTGLLQASPLKRAIFKIAKWLGSFRIEGNKAFRSRSRGLAAQVSDQLVGKNLRSKLGMDQCRILVTGSAPTRLEVMKFFSSFGLFIREVYGLTENLALGTVSFDHMINFKSCGAPFEGNEVKIADDGEVLFRAPWIFKGYYKSPEATSEAFSGEWFKTGDLGKIDDDGFLYIVGRKKELLKTSTGKYVAPVPLEDSLKILPVISDAMVVGDNQKYCIAIVSLDREFETESTHGEIKAHIEEMNRSLGHHEAIQRVGIIKNCFSVEEGTLTPTLKLKRNATLARYSEFIKKVYSSKDFIVSEN